MQSVLLVDANFRSVALTTNWLVALAGIAGFADFARVMDGRNDNRLAMEIHSDVPHDSAA